MDFLLKLFSLFFIILLLPGIEGYQIPKVTIEVNTSSPIIEGSTILLNCTATGDPVPFIHWLQLSEVLTNTSATHTLIQRGDDNIVIIQNSTNSSVGWYVCIAINRVGIDVSDIIKLSGPSLNITTDYTKDVLQYSSVVLPCCIDGVVPREHYWIKTEGNISNPLQHTLVLSDDVESGTYICIGGTENTITVTTFTVTIHEVCHYSIANRSSNMQDSRVYTSLDNTDINPSSDNVTNVINSTLSISQSHTAVLICSMFLNEREVHFIFWQKLNSSPLLNKISGQNTSLLLIPNLQYNDSGTYQCISGTLSNITLAYTNLTVTEQLEIPPTGAPVISTATRDDSLLKLSEADVLKKTGIGVGAGLSVVVVLLLGTLVVLCLCCKKGLFGSSYAKYTGIESERLWDIVTCRRNKTSLLSYAIQVQRPDRVDVHGTVNMIDIAESNSDEEENEEEDGGMHHDSESFVELPVKWNFHRPFDD